jgi:transposase-like protein
VPVQAESGERVADICREHGVSEATFYVWKKKYSGLALNELRELRQLREENGKLKRLVADLSLGCSARRICSSLRAFFAIRVSSSFLSEDHRKADFSTYPWLTFRVLGHERASFLITCERLPRRRCST